jgi:hypothetical protein
MKDYREVLKEFFACKESLEWLKAYDKPEDAWDACTNTEWICWLFSTPSQKAGELTRRGLRRAVYRFLRRNEKELGPKAPKAMLLTKQMYKLKVTELFPVRQAISNEKADLGVGHGYPENVLFLAYSCTIYGSFDYYVRMCNAFYRMTKPEKYVTEAWKYIKKELKKPAMKTIKVLREEARE